MGSACSILSDKVGCVLQQAGQNNDKLIALLRKILTTESLINIKLESLKSKIVSEGLEIPSIILSESYSEETPLDIYEIYSLLLITNVNYTSDETSARLTSLIQQHTSSNAFRYEDSSFTCEVALRGLQNSFVNKDKTEEEEPTRVWQRAEDMNTAAVTGQEDNEQSLGPAILFDGEPSPHTVLEGCLQDCFFIAAVSVVASQPALLQQLFWQTTLPVYGAVGCYFFQDNCWRLVDVDTYIPKDCRGRPVFGKTRNPQETWLALLEKAYAKLYGGYAAINGGNVSEAMRDLTGCAVIDFNTENEQVKAQINDGSLWAYLYDRFSRGKVLMACAQTISPSEGKRAWEIFNGILPNHAYAVIGLTTRTSKSKQLVTTDPQQRSSTASLAASRKQSTSTRSSPAKGTPQQHKSGHQEKKKSVPSASKLRNPTSQSESAPPRVADAQFVRLRNPWGSQKWDLAERYEDYLTGEKPAEDDGEFFMPFNEFCKAFNRIYVCILGTSFPIQAPAQASNCSTHGSWVGRWAGGCNNFASWRHNPLFLLQVEVLSTMTVPTVPVILTISQPDSRKVVRHQEKSISYTPIGLTVVKMKTSDGPMMTTGVYEVVGRSSFWNKRDVSMEISANIEDLHSGVLVVPSTYEPNCEGGFWLSASFPNCEAAVSLRKFDWITEYPYACSVCGVWAREDHSAAGRIGTNRLTSWKNPKYYLKVESDQEAEVFLFLKQKPETGRQAHHGPQSPLAWHKIGIYVLKNVEVVSSLKGNGTAESSDFIGEFKFTNLEEISRCIKVSPSNCQDYTVILMPATFEEDRFGTFEISAQSKVPVQITPFVNSDIPEMKAVETKTSSKPTKKKKAPNIARQLENAHTENINFGNMYANLEL